MSENSNYMPLGRRDFLMGTGGGLVALSTLGLLAGCGGGGGTGDGTTAAGTLRTTGAVNQGEIGGADLTVGTGYSADAAAVAPGGAFSTVVADQNAHAVWVQDGTGAVRGLAISNAASTGPGSAVLQVDAESTTIAMIFITIGLGSIDPSEAVTSISQIRGLSSFPILLALVRARLVSQSYSDTVASTVVSGAAEATIEEWWTKFGSTKASGRQLTVEQPDRSGEVQISAPVPEVVSQVPTNVKMTVQNYGWRYVAITRRDVRFKEELRTTLLSQGPPLPFQNDNAIKGATPLSAGNVFFGKFAQPNEFKDIVDFGPDAGAGLAEYYVFGLGLKRTSVTVPGSPSDSLLYAQGEANGLTAVFYIFGPMFTFFSAKTTSEAQRVKVAKVIWTIVKAGKNAKTAIEKFNSDGLKGAAPAMLDLINTITKELIKANQTDLDEIGGLLGITTNAFVYALKIFDLITAPLNMYLAVKAFIEYPPVAMIRVTTTGGGDITVRSATHVAGGVR